MLETIEINPPIFAHALAEHLSKEAEEFLNPVTDIQPLDVRELRKVILLFLVKHE